MAMPIVQESNAVGKWSSVLIVIFSATYIIVGGVWLFTHIDFALANGLQPGDPYLAILEILIVLSAPAMMVQFAAIHVYARPKRKTVSLSAFGFVSLVAVITYSVHMINLTVLRGTSDATTLSLYSSDGRLSLMLAVDLLGWDFFCGLAMLFAATVFTGGRLERAVRTVLTIGGVLCLIGFSGPVTGDMRLQGFGILGYAFVYPFSSLLLAVLFSRGNREEIPVHSG